MALYTKVVKVMHTFRKQMLTNNSLAELSRKRSFCVTHIKTYCNRSAKISLFYLQF